MKCDAVYKFYVKELPKYECVLCLCSLKMGNERQRLYFAFQRGSFPVW